MHLFEGVPLKERAELVTRLSRRRFLPGEDVVVEGRSPHGIFVLDSGTADVWRRDSNGVEQHLNRLEAGSTFGEISLLTGKPASATVTAVTELSVRVIGGQQFSEIASRFPVVYRNVGILLAERLVRADHRSEPTPQGRLIWLIDHGAPPLLSYALASSMAWHTRIETVLLVSDPDLWDALLSPGSVAATHASAGSAVRRARASVQRRVSIDRAGGSAARQLRQHSVDTIVHITAEEAESSACASGRVVHLARADQTVTREHQGEGETVVLRGWAEKASKRPRNFSAPPPTSLDREGLRAGRLPLGTGFANAVGVVTRTLCELRVGIALGEGSAKGFAHFGALRALERAGVPCDAIAGTSIGAAVAGLHAAGFSVGAAQAHLVEVGSATFRPVLRRGSLMSHEGVERIMRRVWGDDTRIEDLAIPLAVVAADIATGREIVLKRGLLWAAALASISIPGIYPPQRMGDLVLVDGGVVDPVPSRVVRDLGSDVTIAVRLSTKRTAIPVVEAEATAPSGEVPSVLRTIMRSRDLMQRTDRFLGGAASVVIAPEFPAGVGFGLRDFSRGQQFVDIGERAGELALPQLADVLPWLGPDMDSP